MVNGKCVQSARPQATVQPYNLLYMLICGAVVRFTLSRLALLTPEHVNTVESTMSFLAAS